MNTLYLLFALAAVKLALFGVILWLALRSSGGGDEDDGDWDDGWGPKRPLLGDGPRLRRRRSRVGPHGRRAERPLRRRSPRVSVPFGR